MKKVYTLLAFIVLVVLCAVLLPTEAKATETIASGTCGENLTWTLDDTGKLTISGTGRMSDFLDGHGPWYACREQIKNVVIADDITSIGSHAFRGCTSLTSINIPNSVTSIRDGAFRGCTSLTSINIPNSVTSIRESAFSNCSSLTSINIPNSVTHIGKDAFFGCSSLTSINIPDSVTDISENAFYCYPNLTSITVDSNNTVYHSNGNCLIATATRTLILGCQNSVIPFDGSVTAIGSGAFWNCTGLSSITIPDSVTDIGKGAFGVCLNLTSITIPDNVTSIGEMAFYYCTGLTSVTIPDRVTSIGESAFDNCGSLWHVLYKGSQQYWETIDINKSGNRDFLLVTRHYNCTGNEITDPVNKVCTVCRANCTHTWNEGEVKKAATCKEEGVKTFTCTVCSGTKTESIAKLTTHTPGPAATATTDQICTVCGKVLAQATGETQPTAKPTEPKPTVKPTEPKPTVKPTEPKPTETKPAESKPTETKPVESAPTEPTTDSAPTEPSTEPSSEPTTPSGTDAPTTPDATSPTEPDGGSEGSSGTVWIIISVAVVLLGGGGAAGWFFWKKKH